MELVVDQYAIEVLGGVLHSEFNYLLSRELAEQIALVAIQKIALMQEYSGNKVWRSNELDLDS